MTWQVIEGDCVEAMAAMDECSVDAVVTDPPYHLSFMGKAWDTITPGQSQHEHERWAVEALRVLKPGGHLLAFGGTRTYHRLASGIEDAGFEIRDTICWLYGSGFPKSLDVGKAIDKAVGVEREVVGPDPEAGRRNKATPRFNGTDYAGGEEWQGAEAVPLTAPATPEAEQWDGWGTALKPAHEPIVVARKPLAGTVAGNVLATGCGALNIGGCRVEANYSDTELRPNASGHDKTEGRRVVRDGMSTSADVATQDLGYHNSQGRWPANVVLDEEAAAMLDEQTGEVGSSLTKPYGGQDSSLGRNGIYGKGDSTDATVFGYYDEGGASRFFYCAKAGSAERNAGLDGFTEAASLRDGARFNSGGRTRATGEWVETGSEPRPKANVHPTVKPIDLMRWLVRLVTPPGGTVLDPFTGSGTTGCAAMLEGLAFVGIEREPEYAEIARARIRWWAEHPDGMELVQRLEYEREARAKVDAGQLGLFGEAA